jgi:hypothetical protein
MELLQLATALLKAGNELVPDSLAALQHRAQTLAAVASKILPQLRRQRILEHLQGYGLTCPSCRTQVGGCGVGDWEGLGVGCTCASCRTPLGGGRGGLGVL